jgi:hypothetical protein
MAKKKKEVEEILNGWRERMEEGKRQEKKAEASIMRWCKNHYPDEGMERDKHQNSYKCLAKALEYFDVQCPKEVGQLYLEWMVETFAKIKITKNIPDIDFIYQQLVKNDYSEDNSYEYNDMDNHLFYIPTDYVDSYDRSFNIFAITTQSTNYLVIRKIHKDRDWGKKYDETCLYRYWDSYDFESEDKLDIEEMELFKKEGVRKAILMSEWLNWNYSDNIEGRQYDPARPDLKWYKENDFKTSLFCGSIFKVGGPISQEQGAIFKFDDVKFVIFFLRTAFEECEKMEKEND